MTAGVALTDGLSFMYFQSLLPKPEIGANSFLFDFDGTRVVVDSGMHPKRVGTEALPLHEGLGFDALDGIVLTHAHLDHLGSLPLLQRRHPRTAVYMTEATAHLADIMLHNSVNVMTSQREELGLSAYPLFTHNEVNDATLQWSLRGLRRGFEIGERGVRATFFDAGHVLGAVGVQFDTPRGTVLHSGDVHFEEQSIATGADFPRAGVDTLVLEATRGDSVRDPGYTRAKEASRLAGVVRETLRGGGSVLMPVFALGKSQEMLVLMHQLVLAGEIPSTPVFLGGLSTKISAAYDELTHRSSRLHQGLELLRELPDLQFSARPRRGQARTGMAYRPGAIFALSSGMMTENTVSNEFAFQFLENPANTLCFVGYADPESPAGRLKATPHGQPVRLNEHRSPVPLRCRVETFDFSGHSDRERLREYAVALRPKRIILVHGDPPALEWFRRKLSAELPGCDVHIAQADTPIPLA
ncbi:MAG: MBL fold metallo-hydrolase [Verrucomicrobiales bacterium]